MQNKHSRSSAKKLSREKKPDIEMIRHSLAHLMAAAISKLYSGAKFGVGPAIDNGFYYDVELPDGAMPDLHRIEQEMRRLAKQNLSYVRKEMPIKEAVALFDKLDQPYKRDLLNDLAQLGTTDAQAIKELREVADGARGAKSVSVYETGEFVDLCRGPHVKTTAQLPLEGLKLTKIAGAYWRGNAQNTMLSRIYGVAFATKAELEDYIKLQEEIERRDHRTIAKRLKLFTFSEDVGPGLPIWLPNGARLLQLLENYVRDEEEKAGYQHVQMMHIARKRLYEISGHWEHYKEDMYAPIDVDGDQYVLKPMNCPHHIMVYKNDPHSYRDLPLRIAEMATVYRYEKSGELLGLSRVRGFTQNDAHIFCTLDQIDREFTQFFLLMKKIYKRAGIKDYWVRLSLHDSHDLAKYVHNEKMWKSAEAALEKALITAKVPYRKVKGEAAFYGPKADIMAKDVLGREYAISTIQIDFFLPERFDLEYVGKDGAKYRPVMIHRAILGSVERFIAFLLEHTGGDLPLWLAPRQIALITVADKHTAYAKTASAELRKNGFRVWELFDNESVGKKTREAQLQKLPYIAVIGDQEKKSKTITVRKSTAKKLTTFKLSALVEKMQKETR